eukprot:TRINITY_DN4917_c0_g1_i1.p1 TRINITY_DN4917_c0_g1~~TRINITY_DN4917_c0_g1_i1.p1  ORF type:complete len:1091 (+),score=400.24 TRINITY_DN4917_c0_g1_i1:47-3319(+)
MRKRKNVIEDEEDNESDDKMDEENEDSSSDNGPKITLDNIRLSKQEERQVGIIEKIDMTNFMCHGNLTIKLGPHINYITGRNGSGKSAALVALTICLGARTGFTHRASKLKDLIREGHHQAVVSVTLRNRGIEAYKHELYGDSITIERTINSSGVSTFKILSHDKKIIAKKKQEIEIMMEQFGIQISNPCVIMMQETAKQFLTDSSNKTKYKFFLEATQLMKMKNDYEEFYDKLDEMERTLVKKQEMIPIMKSKVKEWQVLYEEMKVIRNLKNKLADTKNQLAWAYVRDQEEEIETLVIKIEMCKEQKKGEDEMLQNFEQDIKKLEETCDEVKENIKGVEVEAREVAKKINDVNELLKNSKFTLNQIKNSTKSVQQELSRLKKKEDTIVETINEEKQKVRKNLQQETDERNKKIREKQEQMSKLANDLRQNINSLNDIQPSITKHRNEKVEIKKALDRFNHETRSIGEKLSRFKESKKNKVSLFGKYMPAILEDIKRCTEFKKAPIGPIGIYIKLKSDKWGCAIENAIGKFLESFICDNSDDSNVLLRIAKRHQQNGISIIIQKFRDDIYRIDRNQQPDEKYVTILRSLQFENNMVANVLVDQARIERIVLSEDRKEGDHLAYNVGKRGNIETVMMMNGDLIQMKGKSKNYIVGKSDGMRLGQDLDQKIKEFEQELHNRRDQQLKFDDQIREIDEQLKIDQHSEKTFNDTKYRLERNINTLKSEISEIEQNVEVEEKEDISDLERNLENVRSQIHEQTEKLQKLMSGDIESEKIKVQELEEQKEKLMIESKRKGEKAEGYQKKFDGLDKERINLLRRKEKSATTHNALLDVIKDLEKKRVEIENTLKENTRKAEQICERIEVKAPTKNIITSLSLLEKKIAEEQRKKKMDIEEVTEKYRAAQKQFNKVANTFNYLQKTNKLLERAIVQRTKQWEEMRKKIANMVDYIFKMNLSRQGHTGKIVFDYESESLDIQVTLQKTKEISKDINQKTTELSGGESSFTTVSLLLSLWETMDTPFCAMDEFDVYMDAVNRRISINLMNESALEKNDRQFIFITPHDLSFLNNKDNPKIRVIPLRPPERGQTTLNFDRN